MTTQAQQQEIIESDDVDVVQYLTFQLDGEAFATEIGNVREVLEHTKITRALPEGSLSIFLKKKSRV